MPTGGIFYPETLLLELGANSHRSMISCKIAKVAKYDLIILFLSWQNQHPLKIIKNPSKWVFHYAKCTPDIGDEAVADLFEGDATMAYDEEVQHIERIRREDEAGVQLEALPRQYWQYKELFEEKKAEMLAP